MSGGEFENRHAGKRARHNGKPWPNMDFQDVVRLTDSAPEEVRGRLGCIVGWGPESDPPELAVWVYDLQEVWSLAPDMAAPTGGKDDMNASGPVKSLRVSAKGEIL